MTDEETSAETWRDVGRLLAQGRKRSRMSKREAARRAGFAEITWRQLEAGERQVTRGLKVPVSPRDDTLEAAAKAVGLDPADVFQAAGRPYEPLPDEPRDPDTPEETLAALLEIVRRQNQDIADLRAAVAELQNDDA